MAVTDVDDGQKYYAQLRGFLEDQYYQKSAVITWLLPSRCSDHSQTSFDPALYTAGFSSVTVLYLQQGGYLCSLLCLRPRRVEALSDAFVCRLSVAYIRPKFRTERPRKTKIGTSLVTRTPLSRSKVNLLLMS